MLRISPAKPNGRSATLKLEGQLIGPWVGELQRACDGVLGEGRPLALDLNDVTFVDRAGVSLLARLREQQVMVTGCSPFLEEQLKSGVNG